MADTIQNAQHEPSAAAVPSWLRRHVCGTLRRLESVAAERRGRLHVLEVLDMPVEVDGPRRPPP
jgi:hypothetical protein